MNQYAETSKEIERLKNIVESYAASARSIALWLNAYCDRSLAYDKMISDAAQKAADDLIRVTAERDAAIALCRKANWCNGCKHFAGLDGCLLSLMQSCNTENDLYCFCGAQKGDIVWKNARN